MKKILIGIALASSLTSVYADDPQKPVSDQATSKSQKDVCIYAGLTYSEGAYIQAGKVTQVCTKPNIIRENVPVVLVWQPVPLALIKTLEK